MKLPLPEFNLASLAMGRGYNGTRSGRYASSRRGPVIPPAMSDAELLWKMSETTTDASASLKATVAEGVLLVSEWRSIDVSGTWGGMRVIKRVAVSEQEFPGLADGEHLWLKITFVLSAGAWYRAQFIAVDDSIPTTYSTETEDLTTSDASDPTFSPHTHDADHAHDITLVAGGANTLSAKVLTSYKKYSSHEYVVDSEELTDTDEICYVKIATFEVIPGSGGYNDRLVIKPHVVGCPITVPLVSTSWGDGVGD